MKLKIVLPLLAIALANICSAAVTVTVANTNIGTGDSRIITNPGGSGGYVGGSWAVGSFANGFNFNSTVADIKSGFAQNGTTATFGLPGTIGSFGGTGIVGATSTDGTDSFTGKAIYIVIGNATTIAASTEFIIYNTGALWPQEVPAVGATVNTFLYNGTMVRGFTTTTSGLGAPLTFANGDAGVAFTAVPETSTALLGAIGALGLLRRRR